MHGAGSPKRPANAGLLGMIDRFVSYIENSFVFVAAVFIFIMMFFLTAEVLGRKLLNNPIPGAIDWVEVWMCTFAFLGAAYCQRLGGHVRMEMLIGRFSGVKLWWSEFFAVTIAFIYVVIIAVQSYAHFSRAIEFGDSTIDIQLLTWPSKLMVPVAMSLLAVRLFLNMWGYARLALDPSKDPVAVPIMKTAEDIAREEIEHGLGHDADTLNNNNSR
jgi:TRAP-type C4-dicarboxylate transport system permease small subunit